MSLLITGLDSITKDGTAANAMGGTELMREALFNKLPPALLNQFQIISSRVRDINPDKQSILWLHDLAQDPEAAHLVDPIERAKFAKLVFVSHWQFNEFKNQLGVGHEESIVLPNAIEPFEDHTKPKDGKINLIYHTTPHRGLELLVPAFDAVYKVRPNIHLNVYSSFSIYGWEQRDEPYKELFDQCRDHPGITYHGARPNSEIREALKNTHIFAYPSIWQETSCIAAIEAMAAGCAVICPQYAALPETTAKFAIDYPWAENPKTHADRFANLLLLIVDQYWEEGHQNKLALQSVYTNNFYNWGFRAQQWEGQLANLLEQRQ